MQSLSLNSKERIEKPSLHIILEWETVAMSLYLLSFFYYLYSNEKSSILLKKWKRWYFNTVLRNTSWKNCLTIFITAFTSKPWNFLLLHFKLWNIRFYPVDKRKIKKIYKNFTCCYFHKSVYLRNKARVIVFVAE